MRTICTPLVCVRVDGAERNETYLLAETDARAAIERQEDERVRDEVLPDTFVQEPVRVKLISYGRMSASRERMRRDVAAYRSVPSAWRHDAY